MILFQLHKCFHLKWTNVSILNGNMSILCITTSKNNSLIFSKINEIKPLKMFASSEIIFIFAENKLHPGIALTSSNVVSSKLDGSALDLHYLCRK